MKFNIFYRAVLLCGVLLGSTLPLRAEKGTEYEVKALYVVLLLKYMTFNDDAKTFNIGIIGDNPFNGHMKKYIGQDINDRKIKIQFFGKDVNKAAQAKCHFYFISSSEVLKQKEIIKKISNPNNMILGDNKWFMSAGGMINLQFDKNSVSWEANKKIMDQKNIKVNFQVYQLSKNKGKVE